MRTEPGVIATHDAQGRLLRYGVYPELTVVGLLVGYVIGALLALSIGYASLKLGFSIEGSELLEEMK